MDGSWLPLPCSSLAAAGVASAEPRMKRLRVLLAAASREEIWPFVRTCQRRRLPRGQGRGWEVAGPGFQGLAILGGMGGEGLAAAVAAAAARCQPQILLVAGFGGALTPVPPPAGLALASSCWRWLPDRQELQPQFLPPPPMPLADLLNHLHRSGLPAAAGTMITTRQITPKRLLLPWIGRLPAPVLDLETADLAALAQARGLPLLVVRAITDGAEEEIQDFLAQIIQRHRGVPLSRLLPALGARPQRLAYLLHLWRRSCQAGANLARALTQILALVGE
jgi:adenosylhomocysteine nucleosidase